MAACVLCVCVIVLNVQACDNVEMQSGNADLHLELELSSDTVSGMMPPPPTTAVPTSLHQSRPISASSAVLTVTPATDKQKPPRRIQLTTLN